MSERIIWCLIGCVLRVCPAPRLAFPGSREWLDQASNFTERYWNSQTPASLANGLIGKHGRRSQFHGTGRVLDYTVANTQVCSQGMWDTPVKIIGWNRESIAVWIYPQEQETGKLSSRCWKAESSQKQLSSQVVESRAEHWLVMCLLSQGPQVGFTENNQ